MRVSRPVIGQERARRTTTTGSCFRNMVPKTHLPQFVLFTVLPAVICRLYAVPLGNLERLSGITMTSPPVSNRPRNVCIRLLDLVLPPARD